MIISWFTDPSGGTYTGGKYSSYYQYDTETKQFTRVRLELGRKSNGSSDSGDTKTMYKEERYVGFSEDKIRDNANWSVDEDGNLCYKGKALDANPVKEEYTYDLTNPNSSPHYGNPVTDTPYLPEGISSKHLALIANDSIVKQSSVSLTKNNATAEDLSKALKSKVSEIVDKPFDEITDEDILNTLKSQVTQIQNGAVSESKQTVDDSLAEVDNLLSDINSQIENGQLTPTSEFEEAYTQLQKSVTSAKTASNTGDVKKALSDLSDAQKAVKTSIENIDADKNASAKESLEKSSAALDEATKASTTWDEVQGQYEDLTNATSVEEYESEMTYEETTL